MRIKGLLVEEGLIKQSSTISDAEGWAIIDALTEYSSDRLVDYKARSAAEKRYVEDWGAAHGQDWRTLQVHLKAVHDWFYEKAIALNEAMYNWQTTSGQIITPSDDGMADLSRNATLLGKTFYMKALRDPGVLPRKSPYTFKYIFKGEKPILTKGGYGYLFMDWLMGGRFSKALKNWKN